MADDPRQKHKPNRRRKLVALLIVYILLLAASHAWSLLTSTADTLARTIHDDPNLVVPMRRADGSIIHARDVRIDFDLVQPPRNDPTKPPVLLLHGSPGNKSNFDALAPIIARHGYQTRSISLPGNGDSSSAPDLSIESQARYALDFLNASDIQRAHIVGWSSGGAVAIHMAHQAPDRIASITLLASIGIQDTEGTGSYHFEHVKYAVGLGLIGVAPELIPHFGALGSPDTRAGWLRGFWDTDQRPMRDIMSSLTTPTRIHHGDDEFLVP